MTKLEQLINKYYATEGQSLSDILYSIKEEQEWYEVANELNDLLRWSNNELD